MCKLTSSLGGYKLTTVDGKIAYYKESEGADSAVPFKNTGIEFDMYCFSNTQAQLSDSRFEANLNNNTVTISAIKSGNSAYWRDDVVPDTQYGICGIYYRIDNASNYTRIPNETTITLENLNYIDVLVCGFYNLGKTAYSHAHIKIE